MNVVIIMGNTEQISTMSLRIFWWHEQCSLKMALASAEHTSFQYRAIIGVQTDVAATLDGKHVALTAALYAATADISELLEPPIPEKFVALVSGDTYTSLSHLANM